MCRPSLVDLLRAPGAGSRSGACEVLGHPGRGGRPVAGLLLRLPQLRLGLLPCASLGSTAQRWRSAQILQRVGIMNLQEIELEANAEIGNLEKRGKRLKIT